MIRKHQAGVRQGQLVVLKLSEVPESLKPAELEAEIQTLLRRGGLCRLEEL